MRSFASAIPAPVGTPISLSIDTFKTFSFFCHVITPFLPLVILPCREHHHYYVIDYELDVAVLSRIDSPRLTLTHIDPVFAIASNCIWILFLCDIDTVFFVIVAE